MSTYFLFSDECGAYNRKPSKGFLRSHPYYVRTSLLLPASEYRELSNNYFNLKEKYGLPKDREIKWSYQWSLRRIQNNGDQLSENHDLYFLQEYDYHDLIDFVEDSLQLISESKGTRVLVTVSRNHANWKMKKQRFYAMHIENHMQRLQFEMADNNCDIAVMFFDSVNQKTDKILRNIYADLMKNNRFELEFDRIKDSLNIEYSHQSIGVQMADFAAGVVNSFFKAQSSPENYERGLMMFEESIKPILRSLNGQICGYGMMEIPTNMEFRKELKEFLND